MSESVTGKSGSGGEELPGFFGTEDPQPEEKVDPEVWGLIDDYLARNQGGQDRLIPLLHRVQGRLGYLPTSVLEYVARGLGMSPVKVYGVVSFYHFFRTTPCAEHQLKVCMGTACFVRKAERLVDTIKKAAGVEVGGLTEDHLIGLDHVRCLGACSLAPAMMVNDDTLGNQSPQQVKRLVNRLQAEAGGEKQAGSTEAANE